MASLNNVSITISPLVLNERAELYRRALGLPLEPDELVLTSGTFLHLDAGTLDLGIVRDSTLSGDYQVFAETFEQVAQISPKQLRE